jgi:hypothetical protein
MSLEEYNKRQRKGRGSTLKATKTRTTAKPRPRPTPGAMNKTEALFETSFIKPKLYTGEFCEYGFESIKLRLAKTTFYTPDFYVVTPNEIIIYEVKGHWEDDARVKIKVAADKYPCFRFIAVQKKTAKEGGGWKFEEFTPA